MVTLNYDDTRWVSLHVPPLNEEPGVADRKAALDNKPENMTQPSSGPEICEPGEQPGGQRSTQIRKAMLTAAAELFAERGFGGTNLRDLADALGMSRPGLYYHFPNKERILEALIEDVTISFACQLDTITGNLDQDPEDALRSVASIAAAWVLQNPVMFQVLDRSEAETPTELKVKHDASKKVILQHFIDIIGRGIVVGKFRAVDPHVAALTIIGMCNWASWWFKADGRLKRDEVASMIAEMAVRSLLRSDAHRSRSDRITDVLRILQEDVAHLDHVLKD